MIVFVIKQLREKKGLSRYKLAKLAGISKPYLILLEDNKRMNPTLHVLESIANVLNVNVKKLFYSELDVEELREEMYRRIEVLGLDSKEVYEISQIIDLLLNVEGTFK